MKKLLVLCTVGVVFFIIVFLVGCGLSKTTALVGSWFLEDEQDYRGIAENIEYFNDGAGIMDGYEMLWKTENDRLFYTFPSHSINIESKYKISGSTMTVTNEDGRSFSYIKSDKKPNYLDNWRSHVEIDPITDIKTYFFRNNYSPNYTETRIVLMIRLDGEELDMYINWDVELGDTDDETIDVMFRIDNNEPETKKWGVSTNDKATFYPDDPLPAIKNLLGANQLTVSCTPPDKSPIIIIFNITGFNEIVAKYNNELEWL